MVPYYEDVTRALPEQMATVTAASGAVETAAGHGELGEVTVIVAASVRLYLDGIALGLEQRGGIRVVRLAANAEETLCAAAATNPQVVLIDISMADALPVIRSILDLVPRPSVIAVAVDDNHDDQLLACAEAGASGWVGQDGSMNDLLEAIRCAARGELACSARMAGLMVRRLAVLAGKQKVIASDLQLTPRELEIAELLTDGMSNKQIARSLSLQLATVKNHVHNILAKLGASSRAEAAARLRETMPVARAGCRSGS